MTHPRITVIVPTRERCDVLQYCLRTVTSQDYADLQIIVSDNYSQDRTAEMVQDLKDPRIRYVNPGRRVNMTHNWEFALSHVESGWATIIGDDDGLLPGSVSRVADIIRQTRTQAIRSTVCTYKWPSLVGARHGLLAVPLKRGVERRSGPRWLKKVMQGRAHYSELPMLYNGGYVDVDVLAGIRAKAGAVYRSCIPDIYAAVSIASTVPSYVYVREPLAINGASKHSTGTSTFARTASSTSPAALFVAESNMPLHADIPMCPDGSYPPSTQALVYESWLQSAMLRTPEHAPRHAEQLQIILAAAGSQKERLTEWSRLFAQLHGLDLDHAAARASRAERLLKALGAPKRVADALDTVYAGDDDLPIRDVYQASLAAAEILRAHPHRVRRIPRLVRRALQELRLYG